MNIPPVAQTQISQTTATPTAPIIQNTPLAPQGLSGSTSTMTTSRPTPEGRCSWLNEGFSTLINKIKDLFKWLKSCFGCSRQQDNSASANNQTSNTNNLAPTSNTQPTIVGTPVVPVDQPAAARVENPPVVPVDQVVVPAVPANRLFGEEILSQVRLFNATWEQMLASSQEARLQDRLNDWFRFGLNGRMHGMLEFLPEEVKLHITNRMEELKRLDDPEVELVDDWAARVRNGHYQLVDEEEPIVTDEEMDLLDRNSLIGQSIVSLMQQIGEPVQGQQFPATLTCLKTLIHSSDLISFIHNELIQDQEMEEERLREVAEIRGRVVEQFNRLPEDVQNRVKRKMVGLLGELSFQEANQIPDWAGRVIRGETQIEGEDEEVGVIAGYQNIVDPERLFCRAIHELIHEERLVQYVFANPNPGVRREILWGVRLFRDVYIEVQQRLLQGEREGENREMARQMTRDIFRILPEQVATYIEIEMIKLKRAADPNVHIDNNWATRVIQGWEEVGILDRESQFNQAITNLIQGMGRPAHEQQPPATLTYLRNLVYSTGALLFLDNFFRRDDRKEQMRARIVEQFNRLPEDIQDRVKNTMVLGVRQDCPQAGEIPDWAGRVIRGEVRIQGENENVEPIQRYIEICSSDTLFFWSIEQVVREVIRE